MNIQNPVNKVTWYSESLLLPEKCSECNVIEDINTACAHSQNCTGEFDEKINPPSR